MTPALHPEGAEGGRAASPAPPVFSWETADIGVLEARARDKGLQQQLRTLYALAALTRRGEPATADEVSRRYHLSAKTASKALTILKKGHADRVFNGELYQAVYDESRTPHGGHVTTRGGRKPARARGRRTRDRMVSSLPDMSGIRDMDAETKYRAMHNAPRGAVTVPLIDRAAKIAQLLGDLEDIDPEQAATMMPAVRCREFAGTEDLAGWWWRFSAACEQRRLDETPDLARLRRTSRAKHLATGRKEPEDERALVPGARAVLDWLRLRPEGATEASIGWATRQRDSTVQPRLAELIAAGLVAAVGQDGGAVVYRAVGE